MCSVGDNRVLLYWVAPFGNLRLSSLDSWPKLIAIMLRPSSALDAKASTMCSLSFDLFQTWNKLTPNWNVCWHTLMFTLVYFFCFSGQLFKKILDNRIFSRIVVWCVFCKKHGIQFLRFSRHKKSSEHSKLSKASYKSVDLFVMRWSFSCGCVYYSVSWWRQGT